MEKGGGGRGERERDRREKKNIERVSVMTINQKRTREVINNIQTFFPFP